MTEPPPLDERVLHTIIAENEDWLIDRILHYAKRQGYTNYASTLREAWRQAVAGLSRPLLAALEKGGLDMELKPDEDYTKDPLTRFVIIEANLHRKRGVSLSMFLGFLKYVRQSYMDLVNRESLNPLSQHRVSLILNRVFDRIEIGLVTAWHVPDENDRMAELQHANRDITNEKNKYVTIFESLQFPVAILDDNHRIVTVNHAWANLFSGPSVPGADYYDETRANQQISWFSEEIQVVLNGDEREASFEKLVITATGNQHLSIKIKQMLDVSEKFSGSVIILEDVTQQKKTESALQETTIWLTETFNALEEAVFIATTSGRIVEINAAAEEIFGYPPAELKNGTTKKLHVDHEHFKEFTSRVRETLTKGEKATFEYMTKRKNGEVFPTMMNLFLLKKPDDTPLGIVCVLRDLSEEKRAEAANQKNERLQGALELAGAVCHEINQPLMAISGYAELTLMDCPQDYPHFDNLEKIISQVAKVGAITKRLMNVTRYETKPYLDQQIIDIEKASENFNGK